MPDIPAFFSFSAPKNEEKLDCLRLLPGSLELLGGILVNTISWGMY